jgi:hypothetical protein
MTSGSESLRYIGGRRHIWSLLPTSFFPLFWAGIALWANRPPAYIQTGVAATIYAIFHAFVSLRTKSEALTIAPFATAV